MAISSMKRVTVLSPENMVDDLLKVIQGLQQIEIIDLNKDNWDDLDESSQEMVTNYESKSNHLIDSQRIQDLKERLHQIERAIELAERFTEKPLGIKAMKEGKKEVSFNHIEFHGENFDEEMIVSETIRLVERLDILDDLIEETREKYNELEKWKNLEITPNKLNSFKYVNGIVGRVPSTNEDRFINYLKESEDFHYEVVFIDENDYGVVVFSYNKDNSQILSDLKPYHFLPFKYTSDKLPQEQLDEWQSLINDSKEERTQIIATLKSYHKTLDELKLQYEYVNNLSARERAKSAIKKSKNLVSLEGWIEEENAADFMQLIQSEFNQNVVITIHEINENDTDIPTKLKNNFLVKPYEMITNMYGVPNYKEVDPTPFVMPFYWLFFGMMIADFGYGLLAALVCLIPMKLFNLDEGKQNMLNLVFSLSLSVIFWGVIYGSFFGFTLPWLQLIDLQGSVMEVMGLSLAIGIIHMGIAFGLNTYLKVKNKEFATAYADGLHWIIVILGAVLLAASFLIPSLGGLFMPGLVIIGLSFIGMFVAYVIDAGSISGLGAGLLGLLNAVSYFGDVISYSRLMALGLSGISIGAAFNIIVGELPIAARFTIGIVIFFALHMINLFLSVLTGGVHALRLIFVEFFGKFYTGDGRLFEPLKINEKYVSIKQQQKMEE